MYSINLRQHDLNFTTFFVFGYPVNTLWLMTDKKKYLTIVNFSWNLNFTRIIHVSRETHKMSINFTLQKSIESIPYDHVRKCVTLSLF